MTKDAEKALKILYCEYKVRRKQGFSKDDSCKFTVEKIIALDSFNDWLREDVISSLKELKSNKFVFLDIIDNCRLENAAIEYMQDKPREYFKSLSHLFDIISLFG